MTDEQVGAAERLALAYAPASTRPAFRAFLALDTALQRIVSGAREPLPAQLRLAWWRDACARLPQAREHPALAALADDWPAGIEVPVALVDAWEQVAVGTDAVEGRARILAAARATGMAHCAGHAPPGDGVHGAARIWSLVTVASLSHDRSDLLRRAAAQTMPRLARPLRPLAVLAGLSHRAAGRGDADLLGDRRSPLAAIRLGIFGR